MSIFGIVISIRRAGLAHNTGAVLILDDCKVDIRIMRALARGAGADFKIDRVAAGFIDKVMAVGDSGFEASGIAAPQYGFAVVLDEHKLAFQHIDELVLV